MIFTFPYRHQRGVDPSLAAPFEPVFRPQIPLRIHGPRGDQLVRLALADSGADETVLLMSMANPLRVKLDSKIHALFGAGGRPILVRYGIVELSIGNADLLYTWNAKVAFQPDRRYSVLGRAGCLDHFSVKFDGPNRAFIVTTP